jgi:hypothetical protein
MKRLLSGPVAATGDVAMVGVTGVFLTEVTP